MKSDEKQEIIRALGLVSSIGFQLLISLLIGIFFGRWLDTRLDTAPWFTVGGIMLGVASGMWGVYKLVTARRR